MCIIIYIIKNLGIEVNLKWIMNELENSNNFFLKYDGSNAWVISGNRTKSGKPLLRLLYTLFIFLSIIK